MEILVSNTRFWAIGNHLRPFTEALDWRDLNTKNMIYRLQEVKDHFELLWSVEAELVHQVLLQKWFQMIPHTPQKPNL